MNALKVYQLLHEACHLLDEADDHAIAAYVGLGMALLTDKYGLEPQDDSDVAPAVQVAHFPTKTGAERGGSWA